MLHIALFILGFLVPALPVSLLVWDTITEKEYLDSILYSVILYPICVLTGWIFTAVFVIEQTFNI